MRTDTFKQAHMLLLDSPLLTAAERKEWLQLLPEMNEKQGLELIRLLSNFQKPKPPVIPAAPKEAPKPKKPVVENTPPPWHLPVDIKQKEIGTSIPEYELELPAPHPAPIKPPQPKEPSLEELHKKVEHMVAQVKTPPPAGAALENLLRPQHPEHLLEEKHNHIVKPVAPVAPKATPVPTAELVLNNIEDFTRLSPAMIHGKNPNSVFGEILQAAVKFARKNPSYLIISNLEQSPLYKTYVDMGVALLNNMTTDRDKAFHEIVENAMKNGKDFFSKGEFEIFIDFRAQLDKL